MACQCAPILAASWSVCADVEADAAESAVGSQGRSLSGRVARLTFSASLENASHEVSLDRWGMLFDAMAE